MLRRKAAKCLISITYSTLRLCVIEIALILNHRNLKNQRSIFPFLEQQLHGHIRPRIRRAKVFDGFKT